MVPATMAGPASRVPPGSVSARTPGHSPEPQPRRYLSDEGIGWIAAHGGAGTTTLARLLGGTDLGCRWPDAALAEPATVMLVGRTNAEGIRALSRALNALREGRHPPGMRLTGLVLLADAPGRLPMALSRRIRVLRSVAPVHRVPWVPEWRLGRQARTTPKAVLRLAAAAGLRSDTRGRPS
ncbi:hypothetical protein ADK66_17275 [Micromonospora sp. NRRL B-16802]|uniref:hypothetical protein n=1 Tax=Micromonospora sp. NRRL B-16802 TaxID=1415541 RepID=UPI0006AF89DA|nr:hypothetical protein [Micromonospora sp. NRRL B-16802]KOX07987.1 hypothetical protein ADK66_17275 [Micromonospora sp. NRRL B-16802]